jgi:hypothetical protein
VPVLALAGALATVPLPAVHFLGPGEISVPASVHFAAVGQTAIFATAAAIILTAIGVARQDGRAVLVGTAFTAMAALLALRAAWSPEKALSFLYEQAGTAFDVRCVEVLSRVRGREAPPLRAAV